MSNFPFPIFIINLDRKPERYKYVINQLKKMNIKDYSRVPAVDGFNTSDKKLLNYGIDKTLIDRKGIAGCAASHVRLWKYIVRENLDWVLILEDDAHFHPKFLTLFNKYWQKVPIGAKIVFVGYCGPKELEETNEPVISGSVMCLQGYILSWRGAKYLLEKLLPINEPIDILIDKHFKNNPGSYIFNGNVIIDGIRPNDYKEKNGKKCMFNGIIYQNQEDQGTTIHCIDTVFKIDPKYHQV